jgi:hypothetical protein
MPMPLSSCEGTAGFESAGRCTASIRWILSLSLPGFPTSFWPAVGALAFCARWTPTVTGPGPCPDARPDGGRVFAEPLVRGVALACVVRDGYNEFGIRPLEARMITITSQAAVKLSEILKQQEDPQAR